MSKKVNPNREKAFEIYKEHQGKINIKRIAKKLNESPRNIKYWKDEDKWSERYNPNGGAPMGNQNALGNKGGKVFEEGNQKARIHGFYSKLLPAKVYDVFKDIEGMSRLDILWNSIKISYANILHAQKTMHVEGKDDLTKELKKVSIGKINSEEYEIQFAWDKQERFLKAQAAAMTSLTKMIREYEELLNKNWDMATEEQKIRIEVMKEKINLEKAKFAYDVQKDQGGNKDNELAKSVKAKMEQRKVEKK